MLTTDTAYLYELVEDYQNGSPAEKQVIFTSFCSSIWNSGNKRRTAARYLSFHIKKDLLDTALGQIFSSHSRIEYLGYQSTTLRQDYASLIRQKANNLYTCLFDEQVILHKDYLAQLMVPKGLYYRWKAGEDLDPLAVSHQIQKALCTAALLKTQYQKQKMQLSWKDYKKLTETYFLRMFENAVSMEEYENSKRLVLTIDTWKEDNYYIRYFCKSLEGYLKTYQKQYYGLRQHQQYRYCQDCGRLYEIKKRDTQSQRCPPCYLSYRKIRKNQTQKLRRQGMKSAHTLENSSISL